MSGFDLIADVSIVGLLVVFLVWAGHMSHRRRSKLLTRIASAVGPRWALFLGVGELPPSGAEAVDLYERWMRPVRTAIWYAAVAISIFILGALAVGTLAT